MIEEVKIGWVLAYLMVHEGLIVPGVHNNNSEILVTGFQDFTVDKVIWESKDWSWNPLKFTAPPAPDDVPDPSGSPKPTWEDLLRAQEQVDSEIQLNDSPFRFNDDDQAQFAKHSAYARIAFCECAIDDVHIGSGIGNMTGLIHHVDSANLAGENLPPVHMRSKKGKLKTYLTQKEMRKVLADVAERENIVESAHNKLLVKFEETRVIYNSKTKPAKERLEARDLLRKMVKVATDPATKVDTDNPRFYQDFLQIEIDAYNPDILPTRLKDLKDVYIERLEGVATAKFAKIKNAATQHGVDLPASCVDQQEGVTQIGIKKQKGHIDILRAKNRNEVKNVFDTWRDRINAVEIVNTPVWSINGQPAETSTKDKPIVVQGVSTIALLAKQPNDEIAGNVIIMVESEEWSVGKPAPFKKKVATVTTGYQITYEIPTDYTGTVDIELEAKNVCGPSKLFIQRSL